MKRTEDFDPDLWLDFDPDHLQDFGDGEFASKLDAHSDMERSSPERQASNQSTPYGYLESDRNDTPSFHRLVSVHEKAKGITMLYWAFVFFIVAIIAAVFGFGGIAAGATQIAQILFFLFLILFIVSLVMGSFRRPPVV